MYGGTTAFIDHSRRQPREHGPKMENMTTHVRLPQWLDTLIFDDLGARYCCARQDMTVIDWDRDAVLGYLGTYFPRSYAEAYCLYTAYFERHAATWQGRERLTVFDFGCGTGGEVIGLLSAMAECLTGVREVEINAFDGNPHALRLFERVCDEFATHAQLHVRKRIFPFTVDDFYDLSVLGGVLDSTFDLILVSKAVCEFVTKDQFEQQNAYAHLARFLLPRLAAGGMMLLTDVTSRNRTSQEWLPRMMDAGLAEAGGHVAARNEGFNQAFTVTHSRRAGDVSKIAWRVLTKP